MAVRVTFDGRELYFPDWWTDEQIRQRVMDIKQRSITGEGRTTDIPEALRRGFAKAGPGIIDLGAGAVGLAGDIADILPGVSGTLDDTERSIRDYAIEARQKIGQESVQDVSDTFVEKVAEGIGAVPGIMAEFAPAMAIPASKLGRVGAAAARFGAHGALMEGGKGLGHVAGGGLKGAAEGAIFGAMGEAASGISSPIGRRLGHGIGTATAVTGLGAAQGQPFEDALASGIAMGSVAALGKNPSREEMLRQREGYDYVAKRVNELKEANPAITEREAITHASKEFERMKIEEALKKEETPEAEPAKVESEWQHRDPNVLKDVETNKVVGTEVFEPMSDLTSQFQPSFNKIREGKMWEAIEELPEQTIKTLTARDPLKTKELQHQYKQLTPEMRGKLNRAAGKEITEHNFVKMQYMFKEFMADAGTTYVEAKSMLRKAMASGNPDAIKAAERLKMQSHKDLEDHIATYVALGREWKHAGRARAQAMSKAEVGDRVLQAIAKKDSFARIPEEVLENIIKDPTNWRAAHEAFRNAVDVKASDYVYEAWINGLLSGPPTHVVNFMSNFVTQLESTVERGLAPITEFGLRKVAAPVSDFLLQHKLVEGQERNRYFSELKGDFKGWWTGAKIGLHNAIRMLGDETYMQELPSTIERPLHAIPGGTGRLARAPSNFLRAADAIFKAIGQQREGYATMERLASQKGLKGESREAFIKEGMDSPDSYVLHKMHMGANPEKFPEYENYTLWNRMVDYGQEMTFTNKLGPIGQLAQTAKEQTPYLSPFLRWIIPFVRTPANIMKYGLKRTPFGVVDSAIKFGKWRKGEIDSGPVADSAAATLIGFTIAGSVYAMAQEGLITGGGPADWNEQLNKRQTGWLPYSIKFKDPFTGEDSYVAYNRLEPVATVMGMAADLAEAEAADDFEVDKLVSAVKENLTNKTFLVGLENLAKAWASPEQQAATWIKQMMGSAVPNILSQGANIADPYSRRTRPFETINGIPEVWASRIPGMSKELPHRYSATGEELVKPTRGLVGLENFTGPEVSRGLFPFNKSNVDPEKLLEAEMDRLSTYEGVPPPMPRRSKKINLGRGVKKNVPLTEAEYNVYINQRKKATEILRKLVKQRGYQQRPDWQKAVLISNIYRKLNSVASNKVNRSLRRRITRY